VDGGGLRSTLPDMEYVIACMNEMTLRLIYHVIACGQIWRACSLNLLTARVISVEDVLFLSEHMHIPQQSCQSRELAASELASRSIRELLCVCFCDMHVNKPVISFVLPFGSSRSTASL